MTRVSAQGSEADAALADAPSDVQPLASLMRVQLALSAGDRAAAAARLADLPEADLRYRPAVVANLSALQVRLKLLPSLLSLPCMAASELSALQQPRSLTCSWSLAEGYPCTLQRACMLCPSKILPC